MGGAGNKSILYVEDEIINAMAKQRELERYSYAVTHVLSGENAVKTIAEGAAGFDLVLMDINLGSGIDGTEAARAIIALKDIPVVFLSSHTEREIVEKTEGITSYGYVVKNSGITVLDASIKMALKLHAANRSLRESEEKYRLLHETAGMGIAYYSIDGIVFSYNVIAARNMGGAPADFAGKSVMELFPEPHAREYLGRIRHAAASETPVEYEDTILLASEKRTFLSTFVRIRDAEGSLLGVQIISSDIGERKETEESLRQAVAEKEMLMLELQHRVKDSLGLA